MEPQVTRFVEPSVVSSHFHIRDGDAVADYGAGMGYFIPELSRLAGASGTVYACEIQKNLVETLGAKAHAAGQQNVHPLWCDLEEVNGIKIPDNTADVGLLINTLYTLEDKEVAAKEMARTLRPGGKFFVIDWTESFSGMGPQTDSVVNAEDARALFENNGFVFETEFPAGAHHYGIAFKKI